MNIIKKLEDSIWAKVILAVVVVVIAFAARSMLENKHEESKIDKQTAGKTIRETSYAETVPEDDPILNVFKNAYPTAEVLLACREDVTDDGLDDLVVICKMEEGNRTIVVTDKGDSTNYDFSDPIPAPVENQKIQFKNIDKEGEIEIIITGEKKGAVGYGHLSYDRRPTGGSFWRGNGGLLLNAELVTFSPDSTDMSWMRRIFFQLIP